MIDIAEKVLTEASDLEMYADQLSVLDDVEDITSHLMDVKERLVDIYWMIRTAWETAQQEAKPE